METKSLDLGRLSPRARFRVALEIATDRLPKGKKRTVRDFAEELDIHRSTLYGVLDGTITSARVSSAIDDFVAAQIDYLTVDTVPA